MPRREQINAIQRAQIIALKGTVSAADLGLRFAASRNAILKVWSRENKRTGLCPKGNIGVRRTIRSSALTSMIVQKEQPARDPVVDPICNVGPMLCELAAGECHWSIGRDDDGQLRFCGCPNTTTPTRITKFYCAAHARAALGDPYNPWRYKSNVATLARLTNARAGAMLLTAEFDGDTEDDLSTIHIPDDLAEVM